MAAPRSRSRTHCSLPVELEGMTEEEVFRRLLPD